MYVCIVSMSVHIYVFAINLFPTELHRFLRASIFLLRMRQLEQCVHLLLYSSVGKWDTTMDSSHRNKNDLRFDAIYIHACIHLQI